MFSGLLESAFPDRPWQGTIGQGHGGWNGIGKKLDFKAMGPKMEQKSHEILKKNINLRRNWFDSMFEQMKKSRMELNHV